MSTNRISMQSVLTAAEQAAIDRFGAAHSGKAHATSLAAFLDERFKVALSLDPDIVAGFAVDGSKLPGTAQGVVRPENERQCAAVLRLSRAAGIPVTVSGGQTNLTGSATPEDGIILATPGLLAPAVKVDAGARLAVVPAGMHLEAMRREIGAQSGGALRFPVDPTSRDDASVGGCLACNASGFTPGESGAIRAWVQALRFLLPNGSLIDARRNQYVSSEGRFVLTNSHADRDWFVPTYRRPAIKNAGGPFSASDGAMDLIDLIVGSEGIFGLVTACTLKLATSPREMLDLFVALPDEDAALRLLNVARAHYENDLGRLAAFEYFGVNCRRYMQHEARFFPGAARVGVFVSEPLFERSLEDAAADWLDLISKADLNIDDDAVMLLDTSALRKLFMEARHSMPANALEVVQQRGAFTIMTDTVVPAEKFGEFLEFTHARIRQHRLDYLSFGHLGDCHLHFTILPQRSQIEAAIAVYDQIIACSADLGGVYSGEHGTGKRKRRDFERCHGPQAVNMVRACKQAVDPDLLLNRGNVVPFSD